MKSGFHQLLLSICLVVQLHREKPSPRPYQQLAPVMSVTIPSDTNHGLKFIRASIVGPSGDEPRHPEMRRP
jgi:hypothetical protein